MYFVNNQYEYYLMVLDFGYIKRKKNLMNLKIFI